MKSLPRGKNWTPAPSVNFSPVPFKLLRVVTRRGEECVAPESSEFGDYAGLLFDPWQRGDLVVVERVMRVHYQHGAPTEHSTWHVGRRASCPSSERIRITLDRDELHWVTSGRNGDHITLWRIAYPWLSTAEKLIGETFETREELENALSGEMPKALAA